MAQQSDFLWELPDLSDIADGPDAFLQFADDIAATIKDRTLSTYTPSWTSLGSVPPTNPSTRTGIYRIDHGLCTFNARLTFAGNTSGGNGPLVVGLPVPASSSMTQLVHCLLWTPSAAASWAGSGVIDDITSYQSVRPHFPVTSGRSDLLPWASTNGFLGLSIPQIPSNNGPSVMGNGAIWINGQYFVA